MIDFDLFSSFFCSVIKVGLVNTTHLFLHRQPTATHVPEPAQLCSSLVLLTNLTARHLDLTIYGGLTSSP